MRAHAGVVLRPPRKFRTNWCQPANRHRTTSLQQQPRVAPPPPPYQRTFVRRRRPPPTTVVLVTPYFLFTALARARKEPLFLYIFFMRVCVPGAANTVKSRYTRLYDNVDDSRVVHAHRPDTEQPPHATTQHNYSGPMVMRALLWIAIACDCKKSIKKLRILFAAPHIISFVRLQSFSINT